MDIHFDLWECCVINTHDTETIIIDAKIKQIEDLAEVVAIKRLGSYGMELIVVFDSTNHRGLAEKIETVLSLNQPQKGEINATIKHKYPDI